MRRMEIARDGHKGKTEGGEKRRGLKEWEEHPSLGHRSPDLLGPSSLHGTFQPDVILGASTHQDVRAMRVEM